MVTINFADYGHPEWGTIELVGESPEVRKGGDGKLLFLFGETHKELWSIGPNAINCVKLADNGIVGLVALEFNPKDSLTGQMYKRTHDLPADVNTIMAKLIETRGEPLFGTTVGQLITIPVRVVEDMDLWDQTGEEDLRVKSKYIEAKAAELFRKLMLERPTEKAIVLDADARKAAEADEETLKKYRDEFGNLPIHTKRDEAMVKTLLSLWQHNRAAVINAGNKHIPRIIQHLPSNVQYVWVAQCG